MRVLQMTLKRRWFDMIASGEKKEEYREIKEYWTSRLFFPNGYPKHYDVIVFRNGYSDNAPTIKFEFKGVEVKHANPAWCGGESPLCYAISIGNPIS